MKMKPHRAARLYQGFHSARKALPRFRPRLAAPACANPRTVITGRHGKREGEMAAGTGAFQAKIYPGRMRSRGGAGVHGRQPILAREKLKGL